MKRRDGCDACRSLVSWAKELLDDDVALERVSIHCPECGEVWEIDRRPVQQQKFSGAPSTVAAAARESGGAEL